MQPLPRPFGTASHAPDVMWPPWTGPTTARHRNARPPELWERRPDAGTSPGERVLADLEPDTGPTDALLILARFVTTRVARNLYCRIPGFDVAVERAAGREYLAAITEDLPEIRWLEAVLASGGNRPGRTLVARLNAAAAAATRRGHVHGAFALRYLAWDIAVQRGWHGEAGRVARAIAAAAERGGGRRSRSLWARRARVHEARASK